jgi:hypothetical protein
VEHRGHERVGRVMPRDVEQGDARHPLASLQVFHQLRLSRRGGVLDSGLEIKPLFEVDVDQVIPADYTVEGKRPAADINALQPRDFPGLWHEVSGNIFEICQLTRELLEVPDIQRHQDPFVYHCIGLL